MSEMSIQALALLLALAAGMLLGVIFFGGLWWTVRSGMTARQPALWFIGSMILRTGIVTMGLYFLLSLSGNSWKILLGGLFGFILARLLATRVLPAPLSKVSPTAEPSVGISNLYQRGEKEQGTQETQGAQGAQGMRGGQRAEIAERVGHAP
ncbi:ATP synthase subunit I [Nitrosospira briensis]|uniref:ATP synthase subunit I n=1 Tax=Nitrosospira briensis TaxID=35799 RepID=UPI0008DEFD6D|nr:ATP synthase subunit I [Nitrosospira briensis]SFN65837.1 F1/F0 ATPase, subunit 2 [Nitrosospira briensis]